MDADIVITAPKTLNFVGITQAQIYKELETGRRIKYFYRDNSYNKERVRLMVEARHFDLEYDQIHYVDVDRFYRIPHGGYVKLEKKKGSK